MVWFVPTTSGQGSTSSANFSETAYTVGTPNVSAGTAYSLPSGASTGAISGTLVRNGIDTIAPTLYSWNKNNNTIVFTFDTDGLDTFVFVVQKISS